jgi:hypothetical protein
MSNIRTGIKMRVVPEQSQKVQEICFENGIEWGFTGNIVTNTDEPFLFIKKGGLSYAGISQEEFFNKVSYEEVSAELFIGTSGTCVESETLTEDNNKGEQMEEVKLVCLVEGYEGTYFEVGQIWLTAQGSEKVKIIQLNEDSTILLEGRIRYLVNVESRIRYSVQLNGKFNKSGLESERDLVKLISTESTPSEPQPKTLSEYLKENNAYESFVENCVEYFLENKDTYHKVKLENDIIYFGNAFNWRSTEQGNNYWYNLHNNQPKNLIYDMNEIIFGI